MWSPGRCRRTLRATTECEQMQYSHLLVTLTAMKSFSFSSGSSTYGAFASFTLSQVCLGVDALLVRSIHCANMNQCARWRIGNGEQQFLCTAYHDN